MSYSHGKTGTRLYRIWKCMNTRCYNRNRKEYKNYGGRGIKLCNEWRGKNGFQNFYDWAMSNGYRDGLTIDRVDTNGNYEPSNCKWSDYFEQANNRRTSITLLYEGKEVTPTELSEITGMSINTIYGTHRERNVTDFTDWKPRKHKHKNIYKRKDGRFEVDINKKYCGRYETLDEAIAVRDRILSPLSSG